MAAALIDRITSLPTPDDLEAVKVFPGDDPLFRDHFPGLPIVPGSLLTHLMSEAGSWLLFARSDFQVWPRLERLERVKFRKFVEPDQELKVAVQLKSRDRERFLLKARIFRAAEQVAEGFLIFSGSGGGSRDCPPGSAGTLIDQLRALK